MPAWILALLAGCVGDVRETADTEAAAPGHDTDVADDTDVPGDPVVPDLGAPPRDTDADGFPEGPDCDDARPDVHPGAVEVCDGVDDDCDGLADEADPDVDVLTGVVQYADDDGDGFGAGEATWACALAPGAALVAGDCDDADPSTFPGATRVCDEVDHACDGSRFAPATATWVAADGTPTDVTATMTGAAGAPATATLTDPGALVFCDDTFFVNLDLEADVDVSGIGGAILDGGGVGTILAVAGDDRAVRVSDLTLRNGQGDVDLVGAWTMADAGGAIACVGERTTLAIDAVNAHDNAAGAGGAVAALGCAVAVTDSDLTANTADYGGAMLLWEADARVSGSRLDANLAHRAGGAIFASTSDATRGLVVDASTLAGNTAWHERLPSLGGAIRFVAAAPTAAPLTLSDTEVTDNVAGSSGGALAIDANGGAGGVTATVDGGRIAGNTATNGGGIALLGTDGPASLSLAGAEISSNEASSEGGGVWTAGDVSLSCEDPAGGIHDNAATTGGGVYLDGFFADATIASTGCEWGATADGNDNDPEDVVVVRAALDPRYEATARFTYVDEVFSCAAGWCGTATTATLGDATDAWPVTQTAVGNVFSYAGPATLTEFEMPLSASGQCKLSWAVLSRPTGSTADWMIEANASPIVKATSASMTASGALLRDGYDYAVVAGCTDAACTITWYTDATLVDPGGFATLIGTWWDAGFTTSFRDRSTVPDATDPALLGVHQTLTWYAP